MEAIVVELLAMPGAGKTHWRDALAASLAADGATVRMPATRGAATKLLPVLGELLRSPRIAALWPALARISRRAGRSRAARVLFNLLYVRSQVRALARGGGWVLLDQGLAQGLWSATWTADDPARAGDLLAPRTLLADLDATFVVVHLAVPAQVCAQRTGARPVSGNPLDGAGARDDDWTKALAAMERIKRRIVAEPGVHYLEFDLGGSETAADFVPRLRAGLDRAIAAAGGSPHSGDTLP